MASLSFYKVAELPNDPAPDSIYYVKGVSDGAVRVYITSTGGIAFPVEQSSLQDLTVVAGSPDTATWDMDLGNVATVSHNADFTMAAPENTVNGSLYQLLITNSSGTNITVTFHADFKKGVWDGIVDANKTTALTFRALNDVLYLTALSENL